MKVASFNVNSLRARLPIVVRWLGEHRPDVLCVQETKVQDADFPGDVFDKAGYRYVFKGQKSYNGVAIFSRGRMKDVECGFADEPRDEARLIRAEVGGIVVVNTYVPQGNSPESEKFRYKLEWFGQLRKYFEKHFKASDPVLWVGDLNIAPEPIDVYDPVGLFGHVCFHPEVQEALKAVCEWGFADVFRKHWTEGGRYTFWDYRLANSVRRNLGWRLDHIMAGQTLAERCTACYIDKAPRLAERPSDHTPIVAEFDW
ncbi:MAG: exodeoxyribonuclease III [Planctomycetota bacterium]|jgi:exodeoxyribonuclease-3